LYFKFNLRIREFLFQSYTSLFLTNPVRNQYALHLLAPFNPTLVCF